MAELAAPIPVTKDGVFTATATHDRFGMTVQSWNAPKIITYKVLGQDAADGIGFMVTEGTRQDTGEPATTEAKWTDQDYVDALSDPGIQAALLRMRDMHDWITGGRIGPNPFTGV